MGQCWCAWPATTPRSLPFPNPTAPLAQPEPPPSVDLTRACPPFTLTNQVRRGYCVRVYDGDTCTVNLEPGPGEIRAYQWKIRLSGLDAPELKSHDPLEKAHAEACREMLRDLILNKYIVVVCEGFEKYGRLLAGLYIRWQSDCQPDDIYHVDQLIPVRQWLLDHTPCVPYDGGTKAVFQYRPLSDYHPHYVSHVSLPPSQ